MTASCVCWFFSIMNILTLYLPSCDRPATDNLQHPGHYLHRRKRPEATLPGPALWPLLQRPQSPQHGRRGPRQHQGERQRAAGGRRAGQQGRGAHHHLGATWDVHHLYWDHHHALHHDHPQTALTAHYPGKADGWWERRRDVYASECACGVNVCSNWKVDVFTCDLCMSQCLTKQGINMDALEMFNYSTQC